ncbi:helix-turn-helix transcriptional regulator [Actinoplanes sp. NPDC051861]|uniref:helix-turn-helix domain-containing protein n=1 Tax=Actinoplanes sp. NPDC051861 TaxID=3155170 RepID=UPI0034130FE5
MAADLDPRTELSDFLRTRRARLKPADLGLAEFGRRRRVPGLKREELAGLAGVSVAYYTRLEQGNGRNVSAEVLDAVARALQLSGVEHAHLLHLARAGHGRRSPTAERQRVRPELLTMLRAIGGTPAYIWGRRSDVLAWNPPAGALFGDWESRAEPDRNWARITFLDPRSRHLFPDWETKAADVVGHLRWYAGRNQDDPALTALLEELTARSDDFRRMWSAHDVKRKTHGPMRISHALTGDVTLHYETFSLPDDDNQSLTIYHAAPGSPSEKALRLLTAGPEPTDAPPHPVTELRRFQ